MSTPRRQRRGRKPVRRSMRRTATGALPLLRRGWGSAAGSADLAVGPTNAALETSNGPRGRKLRAVRLWRPWSPKGGEIPPEVSDPPPAGWRSLHLAPATHPSRVLASGDGPPAALRRGGEAGGPNPSLRERARSPADGVAECAEDRSACVAPSPPVTASPRSPARPDRCRPASA